MLGSLKGHRARAAGKAKTSDPTVGSVNDEQVAGTEDKNAGSTEDSSLALLDEDNQAEAVFRSHLDRKWIILIAVFVVAMMIAGVWLTQGSKIQKIVSPVTNQTSGLGGASKTEPVSTTNSVLNYLKLPEYYRKDHTTLSKDEVKKADADEVKLLPISSTGLLPSASEGYTDNPEKYLNADGTINPEYSYLTKENTLLVIQNDLQRIINPVYGNWTSLQNTGNLTSDSSHVDENSWVDLKDMFDPSVAETMTDSASARKVLNLYADWDQNAYGGVWSGKAINDSIVGVPVGTHCDYAVHGATDDHIDCTYKIRYTGKINNQYKSVDKTLKLHYKINYDDNADHSQRRVLLTSVEQQ
jgi:virulence-associated protein VagC